MTIYYELSLFAMALLLWGYWWRFRLVNAWWRSLPEAVSGSEPALPERRLSIIIPSRNESERLPALLESLRGEGRSDTEIIVVDDQSTDRTSECVAQAAARDPRVRACSTPARPEGWAGKTWAMRAGVGEASGQWLLFCDADVVFEGGDVVDRALAMVAARQLEALSLLPRMEGGTLGAGVLLAAFTMARALVFMPALPERRGLVQGGFFMMSRDLYGRIGGIDSVRGSLLEDVELGWRMHTEGARVQTCPAHDCLKTLMYDSFGDAWRGMCKHLYPVLGCSVVNMLAAVLLIVLALPAATAAALVAIGMGLAGALSPYVGLAGVLLLALITYCMVGTVRRERLPLLTGLILPWSVLLLVGILIQSFYGYRLGKIVWKGRSYRPGQLTLPRGG